MGSVLLKTSLLYLSSLTSQTGRRRKSKLFSFSALPSFFSTLSFALQLLGRGGKELLDCDRFSLREVVGLMALLLIKRNCCRVEKRCRLCRLPMSLDKAFLRHLLPSVSARLQSSLAYLIVVWRSALSHDHFLPSGWVGANLDN